MPLDPNSFLVFNDFVKRGRFGERTLWTYLVEDLGLPYVDFEKLRANSWYEAKLNLAARGKDAPKVGIQNATWAHPNTCGATKNVVILQDNIIRMWNDPVPQRATLDAADIVVCNGPLIASDYASICGSKTRVIPIGIDVEFWQRPIDGFAAAEARRRRHANGEKPRVVYVGDEAPHKGYEVIAALARKRRDLDWTFVLKHRDQHDESLGTTCVAAPPSVVRGVLHISDVFILGSPVETQCLAALEAMACAVPVVMRPTGAFSDWRPKSFFGVDGSSVEAFDAALRNARTACREIDPRADLLAAERFTIPAMLASWRELLEEVASDVR